MVEHQLADGSTASRVAGLRTTDAVSKAITSEQVLGSIIGFGLIYGLLFMVWLFVLNHKIHQGPEPAEAGEERHDREGLFEAAAGRVRSDLPMTGGEARDQDHEHQMRPTDRAE
jgi:cytochrome d ubiquinol oxidase subunit I